MANGAPVTIRITKEELEALMERAAAKGAKIALENVGLHDEDAFIDIRDMRSLMESWRQTKKSVVTELVRWVTLGVLALIIAGVYLNTRSWK